MQQKSKLRPLINATNLTNAITIIDWWNLSCLGRSSEFHPDSDGFPLFLKNNLLQFIAGFIMQKEVVTLFETQKMRMPSAEANKLSDFFN